MRDGVAERAGLARVVLAREEPFRVGLLWVDPRIRQVSRGGRSETLEPRVMQVLVVLGRAPERVIGRDELVERCWDGRIVTDDAINRVLSRIRQVAAGAGGESFTVETIVRVGYRLNERVRALPEPAGGAPAAAAAEEEDAGGPAWSRRKVMAAAGGVALLGAAATLAIRLGGHRPDPEAVRLVERGDLLMREGLPGQTRQAASYFEQAAAADPDYAVAWGRLALAYGHQLQGFDPQAVASLPAMIRSAAERAQRLDPGNADAEMALIFTTPIYRRWADKERRLRAVIARHPRHWLAHGRLGLVLQQVGRFEEALASNGRAVAIEPILPVSYALMANALGALGRLQEADALIARGQTKWPANPALWMIAYNHLLFSGRAQQAAALAMDPSRQPQNLGEAFFEERRRLAEAVAGTDRGARTAAAAALLEGSQNPPFAARTLMLLGQQGEAEAMLRDYLLGQGAADGQRSTDMLFLAPLRGRQPTAAEAALLRETGLSAYWAETRTRPDV